MSASIRHPAFGGTSASDTHAAVASSPVDGFTLIELLIALAIFAAMAAAAYGGLSGIARTRTALVLEQDRFAAIERAVSDMDRDLAQAVSRPVRDNYGAEQPALIGTATHVELTRLGFANPRAEARSNLERAIYAYDDDKLERGRYAALDRAPDDAPKTRTLLDHVAELRLRYLGADGAWQEIWPPPDLHGSDPLTTLPIAVEFRMRLDDLGELRRVVELPSSLPSQAIGHSAGQGGNPLNAPPATVLPTTGAKP
ncbi:MAG: type II secretion system minor pseudopilin GspJ [Rhodanobacteraceae bacterium]